MPYFEKINLLFIHIPKTGGTSIENYFYKKYNVKRNIKSLYTDVSILNEMKDVLISHGLECNWIETQMLINNHSLQHSTFKEIYENRERLNIKFNDELKIIAVLRNPYERIISDLFFFDLINIEYDALMVEEVIRSYLTDTNNLIEFDNHPLPQYMYLINEQNEIDKRITILNLENIHQDMFMMGYNDFNVFDNITNKNSMNYFSLLTDNSINMINKYYKKDFEYFSFKMIHKL